MGPPPRDIRRMKKLNDKQVIFITSLMMSGSSQTVRKLIKARAAGAQPIKLCRLVDILPEAAQLVFNGLVVLPAREQAEICSLAVAVERILLEALEFDQPYPLTLLISKQVRNKGLFPGPVAGVSRAIETVLQVPYVPVSLSFQSGKRMIEIE